MSARRGILRKPSTSARRRNANRRLKKPPLKRSVINRALPYPVPDTNYPDTGTAAVLSGGATTGRCRWTNNLSEAIGGSCLLRWEAPPTPEHGQRQAAWPL